MNERILKLAEQADIIEWDSLPSGARTPDHESYAKAMKFAQLIVRECLEQIDKIRDGLEEDNEAEQALGADWAGLAVARHFGVEE